MLGYIATTHNQMTAVVILKHYFENTHYYNRKVYRGLKVSITKGLFGILLCYSSTQGPSSVRDDKMSLSPWDISTRRGQICSTKTSIMFLYLTSAPLNSLSPWTSPNSNIWPCCITASIDFHSIPPLLSTENFHHPELFSLYNCFFYYNTYILMHTILVLAIR